MSLFILDARILISPRSELASTVQSAALRSLVSLREAVIANAVPNRILIAAETDKFFGFPRKTTEQRF